jgi:hypothetical protein
MDNQPSREERFYEALEVCRPGGDDLADAAMADLAERLSEDGDLRARYERIQQIDLRLAAAFQEVPVPEGLAERIHARLAANETAPMAEPVSPEDSPVGVRRRSRRHWLAAAGGLATAAAAMVAVAVLLGMDNRYDEATVLGDTVALFSNDLHEGGLLLSEQPPPDDFPPSREIRRPAEMRWRSISGLLGKDGVAYDLPGPGGSIAATLYVVRLSVDDVRQTQPAPSPRWNTGGYCSSAWQEDDLLYILVVRGGRQAYYDCLAPPGIVT